jgi:hypothetical protein
MYNNIPKLEVINRKHNNHPDITKTNQKDIIHLLKSVMEQNYFQFNQQYCKQTEGLAMGVPTSAILDEVYIQHMEHKQLCPNLEKHQIIGYLTQTTFS